MKIDDIVILSAEEVISLNHLVEMLMFINDIPKTKNDIPNNAN